MLTSVPSISDNNFKSEFLAIAVRYGGIIAWLAIAFAAIVYLQTPQLRALKQRSQQLSPAEIKQEIDREKARLSLIKALPSFGFNNLIADWQFMDFLQYFGDSEARQRAGYGVAMDYFDIIIDRDPRFLYAYYYLSNTGSLYVGQPEKSVALMNQGLKSVSPKVPDRSYYIWRLKGVDELLFLGNVKAARQSMQTAADWARQYPDREGQNVAHISQNTARYLARNPKSKQAQFDAWNMVLNNAVDDSVIKRAIAEIQALGGQVKTTPYGQFQVIAPKND
jgi:tetratricopeptide (TPR) repeat protein